MRNGLIIGALAAAGAAHAADLQRPQIAPPAAWVVPAPLPPLDGKPTEAPFAILLRDQQLRLSPDGDQTYVETVVRVQTPDGLNAMGTVALPWKPDSGAMTIHKLRILRAGKEIDLLKDGSGITVLRRENNLEAATLDGVLTAVIQPEGLQVGDAVDMAMTMTNRDPVLVGHSEGALNAATPVPIGQLRLRAIWDGKAPIRYRAAEATPPAKLSRHDGLVELAVRADDVQPPLLPKGAPARFAQVGFIEFTSFASWAELSTTFAPLYAKAETLGPESLLKAEIARIAAASTDPVRRAEAALALVQSQIRYFAIGLGDGGLRPADADVTWQRRFADCKGKTVLLLALLHGLGIEAEPAIVSSRLGDGLDQHLPTAGSFDHIIVRATIGGKVNWLDGTRTGDKHLADIEIPPFHWALPVRTAGATLVPLVVPPPAKPTAIYRFKLDLTAGVTRPAPMHIEETSRGDEARTLKLQLANLTPDARDRALRDYFKHRYEDLTVTSATSRFDDATGDATLVADGTLAHDFARFRYDPELSGLGFAADFDRKDGLHRDAPYAVAYPRYVTAEETVTLPNQGRGFKIGGADVATTIAGVEYQRTASLSGGTYHVVTTERSVAPEFPASQAAGAQTALRDLNKDDAWIATTDAYRPTRPEEDAIAAGEAKTLPEYLRRAAVREQLGNSEGALADLNAAVAIDPHNAFALGALAAGLMHAGKMEPAVANAEKALAINPDLTAARMIRVQAAISRFRFADTVSDLDIVLKREPDNQEALQTRAYVLSRLNQGDRADADAARLKRLTRSSPPAAASQSPTQPDQRARLDAFIANDPGNLGAHLERARLRYQDGHYAQALEDTADAIRTDPGMVDVALLRANIHVRMGHPEKAAEEMVALVKAAPDSDYAHIAAAATYVRLGRRPDADREFDRALALKPSVAVYLTRANNRLPDDIAGKRADLAAALKLEPDNEAVLASQLRLTHGPAELTALLPMVDKAMAASPDDADLRLARGIAYTRLGKTSEAEADFAAARTKVGNNAAQLNSMCWTKATEGVALDSALADCDAAIKISSNPNIIDSRAFVLLRLGRFAEAITAYDAAIKAQPKEASSLYGRGLAELRAKRDAAGQADIAAAKALDPEIAHRFAGYGLTI